MTRLKHLLPPLLLIGFSTFTGLLVAEITLRLAYDHLPLRIQQPIQHVGKWGPGYPPLGPSWFETCVGDLHLSARNLPNLTNKKVQFGPAVYAISTDRLGFEDVAFRTPNSPPPWDGIVVGDSFGFCHHINYEHCWVTQVEKATELRLANLSVPATGSVSHSRYLEKYGRQLNPHIVLWQYWVNDTREDVEHIHQGFTPCPRDEHWIRGRYEPLSLYRLVKNGSAVANLAHSLWTQRHNKPGQQSTGVYRFETTSGRKLFAWKGEGPAPASSVEKTGFRHTANAIKLGADRTREAGGKFLLLLPPSNLQTYAHELPTAILRDEARAENKMTDRIIEFAKQHNIAYLDLREAFIIAAKQGQHLYPDYDIHWTHEGNELAAKLVSEWLVDNLPE